MNRRTARAIHRTALGLLPLALAVGLLGAPPAAAVTTSAAALSGTSEVTAADRGQVVDYWREGGPGIQAAAEELTLQDERVTAAQIASVGGPELLTAAREALAGPREQLESFVSWGWEAPMQQDNRVRVAQIVDTAGPNVREAGQAALNG